MRGFSSTTRLSAILKNMLQLLFRWVPVLLWAGLIYGLSSISDFASPFLSVADIVLRKFAHAFEFGVFTLLLIRAFHRSRPSFLALSAIIAILYAISDELHQGTVAGRVATVHDVAVDTLGAAIVALTYAKMQQAKNKLTGRPLYR